MQKAKLTPEQKGALLERLDLELRKLGSDFIELMLWASRVSEDEIITVLGFEDDAWELAADLKAMANRVLAALPD
jgi:hypothetical protein